MSSRDISQKNAVREKVRICEHQAPRKMTRKTSGDSERGESNGRSGKVSFSSHYYTRFQFQRSTTIL